MSIIIRPSDSVFKRTTPLVLIFGAYRRFELDPPLSQEELDTITQVVALSRRLRAPLAFSRLVPEDRAPEAGVWLPDCRPKITDRVFDHAPGSMFQNREFANAFRSITRRDLVLTGPRSDSSLMATARDSRPYGRDAQVVLPDGALHIRSTATRAVREVAAVMPQSGRISTVNFSEWEQSVCVFE
ncbi:isochorismatase family protein [Rhodobacteraceae bacterium 2CG4]|uniref:Isochorismatase family protein n=1 Tax=Halovulum marinum TaxID=2662447 RepID=A0A6L5YVR1_9RHOB|nr:isochorismatase family protein [Halovulum marinum]MSU88328.1 isochorismatase family protein [Halovulum marinum]